MYVPCVVPPSVYAADYAAARRRRTTTTVTRIRTAPARVGTNARSISARKSRPIAAPPKTHISPHASAPNALTPANLLNGIDDAPAANANSVLTPGSNRPNTTGQNRFDTCDRARSHVSTPMRSMSRDRPTAGPTERPTT